MKSKYRTMQVSTHATGAGALPLHSRHSGPGPVPQANTAYQHTLETVRRTCLPACLARHPPAHLS